MLEGDLSDFSLADILKLLAFTSKTGRLQLAGEATRGRVDVVDGRVHDASADAARLPLARRLLGLGLIDGEPLLDVVRDRDELPTDRELASELVTREQLDAGAAARVLREQTVDAVFDLSRWSQGSFTFEAREVPANAPIELASKVDDLLEEAEGRLQRWVEVAERTGADDAVVALGRPDEGLDQHELDADAWSLLALIDGRRTVAELIALTGRGAFDTRVALAELLDRGVVRIASPEQGSPVENLVAHHEALARLEGRLGGDLTTPLAESLEAPVTTEEMVAALDDVYDLDTPDDPPPVPTDDLAAQTALAEVADLAAAREGDEVEPWTAQVEAEVDDDGRVTPLRMKVRQERLRTDPSIDEDLVDRLIDGVKEL